MRPPRATAPLLFAALCTLALPVILTPLPATTSQMYLVCRTANSAVCTAWAIHNQESYILQTYPNGQLIRICGFSNLKKIYAHRKFFKVKLQEEYGSGSIFCNIDKLLFKKEPTVHNMYLYDKTLDRKPRAAGYGSRGRYRGQTQSQYLSIDRGNNKDEGKAEAHSDADSSRASVSGTSGMGQAQSQSMYDPSCDECLGKSEIDADNLKLKPSVDSTTSFDNNRPRPGSNSATGPENNWLPGTTIPGGDIGSYQHRGSTPGATDTTGSLIIPGGSVDVIKSQQGSTVPNQGKTPGEQTGIVNPNVISNPGIGVNPNHIFGSHRGGIPVNTGVYPNQAGQDGSIKVNPSGYVDSYSNQGGKFGLQPNQGGKLGGGNSPYLGANMNTHLVPNAGGSPNGYPTNGGSNFPNQERIENHNVGQSPIGTLSPNQGGSTSDPNRNVYPHQVATSTVSNSFAGIGSNNQGSSIGTYPNLGTNVGIPYQDNNVGFLYDRVTPALNGNPILPAHGNWPINSRSYIGPNGLTYYCCVVSPNQEPTQTQLIPGQSPNRQNGPGINLPTGGQFEPGQFPSGTIVPGHGGTIKPAPGQHGPVGPSGTDFTQMPGQYPGALQGSEQLPSGQYTPGQFPRGQHVPVAVPGAQYGPGSSLAGVNGPGQSPGGQYQPVQSPGGQYGPGQSPAGTYGPGKSPGGQYGSEQSPGGQYGPGQTFGGQYGPVQSPVGTNVPGQAPIRQYGSVHSQGGTWAPGQLPSGQYGIGQSPGGQYGLGQSPGRQYEPGQLHGGQYGPQQSPGRPGQSPSGTYGPIESSGVQYGQLPGVQYGPGQSSGGSYRPRQSPVETYGPVQSPGGLYERGQTPGGTYRPGQSPIRQYRPGQVHGGQFGPGQSPAGTYGPGSSLGGQYEPGRSPSGTNAPGLSPSGQYGPGQLHGGPGQFPAGTYGPGQSPGGQYAPGQSPGKTYGPDQSLGGQHRPGLPVSGTYGTGQSPGGQYGPGQSPDGAYGPGQSAGGQYGPGQSPDRAYGPGRSPGGQYGPGQSPDGAYSPGQSPGGQYGPGQSPDGVSSPGQSPGQYGPGQSPDGAYGPGQSPGGQYGPGQSPDGASSPGQSPGQYGPGQSLDGAYGPGQSPGGQYGPGQSPDGAYGPGKSPGGQYGPGQSPDGASNPGQSPGQYGPGQSPDGAYGPGQSPGGQYGPGQSPDGASSPGQSPGQYGPGQSPDGAYGPGQSPGGQNGPGQSPDGAYGPGRSPGGQYGPGQSPDGASSPGQSPGQYGPGQSPDGAYGPGQSPGGQYGPGQSPDGAYGPEQSPGGQYGPGQSSDRPYGPGLSPSGQYGPGQSPGGQYGPGQSPDGAYGPGQSPGGQYGPVLSPGVKHIPGQSVTGISKTQYISGVGSPGIQIGPTTGIQPTDTGHGHEPWGTETSNQNGIPQNVRDPNSIAATLDDYDSNAEATVAQNNNGTIASASSRGGNDKGRAETNVQGTYSGSGSFSAQAEISDENKAAQSQIEGSKKGAKSSAQGRGRNNLSQASVQLGSETGSLQTAAETKGSLHSSNSKVQGSVKGGMSDAQAKGPGSTSSQAQIGFTPYKQGDKAHDQMKTPFVGQGTASAQSSGRSGQSQSSLGGTFKYGISYSGAAQSGASLDKDAVFPNRLPYNNLDVYDESNKNINVDTEGPLDTEVATEKDPTVENKTESYLNDSASQQPSHTHSDHHTSDKDIQTPSKSVAVGTRRSFQPKFGSNSGEFEYTTGKEDVPADDYYPDGGFGPDNPEVEPNEYANYDEYTKDADNTHQSLQTENKGMELKQNTGGNTQHIVLGSLGKQDAEITQQNSENPDESRIYQPGEKVPGTGGYTIPIGFTGSVKSVASKDKTYVVGYKDSPSQAQTVALSPGSGKVRYVYPSAYGRNVKPKELRSLYDATSDDSNKYMSVSKSVTKDLDSENNIRKQYSHTYYTKSSSCGYFTFTCTMVSGANGRKKVCKPKIPTNPDGSPMKC